MMNVLIVDDSKFLRKFIRQNLEQMGLDCEEATNGAEALHRLETGAKLDCMLLDMNMPVMGGLECVRTLRERSLQPDLKVMMVTTEFDSAFIEEALGYGADEFLMKPFTPASLRDKLMILGF